MVLSGVSFVWASDYSCIWHCGGLTDACQFMELAWSGMGFIDGWCLFTGVLLSGSFSGSGGNRVV